ncbi:hypothetical protein BD414DRAFT_579436 [Trametes punicea]|nr:hypothetical protein BD414DRAFT_579436 [Trametes punicea]
MVRAQGKQTPEEKKDGKKKSSNGSAKKKPETGSWPCKMDGCKKVFAREADLKRHQRTTKTHSIPGFQCPQCDATFTRTDALRRHQKSRHNGVVIEPSEEKGKHPGDGASSGSRSPSPGGTPSRSHGEGSMNGSPPATQSSNAGSSAGPSSYYRPHTMQDGGNYYAGYPPPPRPPHAGMMMDPHYPPPPIGLPTSATRSNPANWQPAPAAPPWGPDGHPMAPSPGMFVPSYYPSPYYRHPGMPMPPHSTHFPPQINPDLLSQSNGQMSGVVPPESALRNTTAEKPEGSNHSKQEPGSAVSTEMSGQTSSTDPRGGESLRAAQAQASAQAPGDGAQPNGATDGPDASTLMAAAALQAVLAFQKEQELKEAASRRGSAAPDAPTAAEVIPQPRSAGELAVANGVAATDSDSATDPPKVARQGSSGASSTIQPSAVNAIVQPRAEPGTAPSPGVPVNVQPSEAATVQVKRAEPGQQADATPVPTPDAPPQPMEQLMTEDGMPMLNPAELLTQESLASPPPS